MHADSAPQITYLYRLFNEAGELLYVGIAKNTKTRFAQHAKDKAWWGEVATSRVEQCRTLAIALAEESTAILWEKPSRNLAIPSLARHDTLQERAARDPFASLDVAQRLAITESLSKRLECAEADTKRARAALDETVGELQAERKATIRVRSDISKLTAAIGHQQREIAAMEQRVVIAERDLEVALQEARNKGVEAASLRASLDQAAAALRAERERVGDAASAATLKPRLFGRRKASALVPA